MILAVLYFDYVLHVLKFSDNFLLSSHGFMGYKIANIIKNKVPIKLERVAINTKHPLESDGSVVIFDLFFPLKSIHFFRDSYSSDRPFESRSVLPVICGVSLILWKTKSWSDTIL